MSNSACLKSLAVLSCLLCAGMSLEVSASAGTSEVVVQFTPHDRLFSVAFSGDVGVAVGENGLLLETTDGGRTWQRDPDPPTQLSIFSIAVSGPRSIAVGQQGLILVREDQKPWRRIDAVTDQRLLRVSLNRSGVAVAVGAFGTLLKSSDYGETWIRLEQDWVTLYGTGETSDFAAVRDEPVLYVAKVLDDGAILIGGEYGQINRSVDGGATWMPVVRAEAASNSSTPPTLFGMHIGDDGVGYAVGQEGVILKTANHGKTWKQISSYSRASLFDVYSTTGDQVFVVGMRIGLHSEDGGETWRALNVLDMDLNWYSGLGRGSSTAIGSIISVGHSGRVVRLAAGD